MRRPVRVEFHPRRGRVVKLVPDQATSVARPSDQRPAKLDESPSFGQNPGAMADFCFDRRLRDASGPKPRPRKSKRQAKDHVEGKRIRRGPTNRPTEAKDKIGFYKISREETVLDRKTLDNQWRDSKLR